MSFFKKNQFPPEQQPGRDVEQSEHSEFVDPRVDFGVTINIDDVDALYEALEEADDSEPVVFSRLLPDPVEKVSLIAKRNKTSFMLYGTVDLASEKYVEPIFDNVKTSLQLLDEDVQIKELSSSVVIEDGDAKLLLAKGGGYSDKKQLIISTGKLRSSYREYSEAFPPPENSLEAFRTHMQHVIGGLTLAMALAYGDTRSEIPVETINLTMPRQKFKYPELSSLMHPSEQTKTPEDISQQFGVEFPKVSFDEIGGQAKAKEEIQSLAFAITHPEAYTKWGTRPPKGILLHGPPGTGKTLLAKALASEAEAAFYAITPSDITAKWYGESEKRVKEIFNAASKQDKAIIYFDELDAIIPNRDNGAHEATQRVVSSILQHLDGIRTTNNVMVVASTNRKDAIDPAMLRPGRLDRLVSVELPGQQDRAQIFSIHATQAEHLAERSLFDESITYETLATLTDYYSGADIAEIIRRTLEMKVRAELYGLEPSLVDLEDIKHEIEQYERNRTENTGRSQ